MPAIPQSTQNSITLRLLHHGRDRHPALARVTTHFRGPFAYVTGVLPDSTELPLAGCATAAPRIPSASRSTRPPAAATTTPFYSPDRPSEP